MYEYKSEILKTGVNWFSDKANVKDADTLDKLLNEKAKEGWELVTYDYMTTSLSFTGAFFITFRKKID